MSSNLTKKSAVILARITGLLYLLPFAPLSMINIPNALVVNDPATTVANITAHEMLFRFGIVSQFLSQISFLFIGLFLYKLLKPVSKNAALLMVILNLLGISITMYNEITQFAVLEILHGASYLAAFTAEQQHGLIMLLLNLRFDGINIAQIFWALWLFPMGYLVYKSKFLPRVIGILLVIAGLGYLIQTFAAFFNYNINIIFYTGLGEAVFGLWLLIRGLNADKYPTD